VKIKNFQKVVDNDRNSRYSMKQASYILTFRRRFPCWTQTYY